MRSATWLAVLVAAAAVGCTVSDRSYDDGEEAVGSGTSGSGGSQGPDGSVGSNTGNGNGNGGGGAGGTGGSDPEGGSGGGGNGQGASASSPDASMPVGGGGGGGGGGQTSTNDSGATPQCDPKADEDCFNGVDDDCNQLADCADPACSEAVCAPAADVPGVLVGIDEDCPAGYREQEIELHQRLSGGGCTGCSCTSTPTECTADVFFYEVNGDCAADTGGTLGLLVAQVTSQCPSNPLREGNWPGWRVGAVTPVGKAGKCTAQGTPAPEPATWAVDGKFCVASRAGVGCQFGYACLPAPDIGTPCGASDGACPGSLSEQTWFEDFDDTRTCGSCTCGGDGNCDAAVVEMGSDWSCFDSGNNLRAGEKSCAATPYSPPARIVGNIKQPSCDSSVTTSGAVVATGEHTLCCE